MQDVTQKPNHKLYGGIAASVALHVMIAIALFARLPADDPTPPKEETVSVEIVPPPEENKQEEPALKLAVTEEKPQPASPPEQPKQEAEEAGAKPPEPVANSEKPLVAQEEAKQQPPPDQEEKVPDEKAQEQTPPPPPPSEIQDPEQQASPPSSEQAQQQVSSLPAMGNVFQFGEKTSDPHKSDNGDAVQDSGETTEVAAESAMDAVQGDHKQEEDPSQETKTIPDMTEGLRLPPDVTVPGVNLAGNVSNDIGSASAPDSDVAIAATLPSATAKPAPNKADTTPSGLKEAKTLFSRSEGAEIQAITAMGNMPRKARVAQLCSTELKMQLRHARHWPDMLPSSGLSEGTLLDVPSAAFHDSGKWYEVSYRCEIDQNATKVLSFAMKVGQAIPQNQWRQRGLPAF